MSNDNRNDDLTRLFCEAVERERAKMRDSSLTGIAAMEIKSNTDFIIDTLTPMLEQPLLVIIAALKIGTCWCQVGIDNPMMAGQHSPVCLAAQKVMTSGVELEPSAAGTVRGIDAFVDELRDPPLVKSADQIRTILLAFAAHVRRNRP